MRSAAAPNDERALLEHLRTRSWFGGKTREAASAEVVETAVLPGTGLSVSIVLVRIGYTSGMHELYQLISRPTCLDALAEQQVAQELVSTIRRGETIAATDGAVEFRPVPGAVWPSGGAGPVRGIGVEQTNTSIVLGDEVILKVFRRIEPGVNNELELLHFLTV